MKNIIRHIFSSVLLLCFFHGGLIVSNPGSAYAQQDWKQEYSAVCADTQNVMLLTSEELKNQIDRCDKLLARIDGPDGLKSASEKKVYGKRLKMCRDLYEFSLNHKEQTE